VRETLSQNNPSQIRWRRELVEWLPVYALSSSPNTAKRRKKKQNHSFPTILLGAISLASFPNRSILWPNVTKDITTTTKKKCKMGYFVFSHCILPKLLNLQTSSGPGPKHLKGTIVASPNNCLSSMSSLLPVLGCVTKTLSFLSGGRRHKQQECTNGLFHFWRQTKQKGMPQPCTKPVYDRSSRTTNVEDELEASPCLLMSEGFRANWLLQSLASQRSRFCFIPEQPA
jgi:hypothetical protein